MLEDDENRLRKESKNNETRLSWHLAILSLFDVRWWEWSAFERQTQSLSVWSKKTCHFMSLVVLCK